MMKIMVTVMSQHTPTNLFARSGLLARLFEVRVAASVQELLFPFEESLP